MRPKDAIKGLAKDTRENLQSYFPEVEKSLGEPAEMLLPKTIPNHLSNAGNHRAFWLIRFVTGCGRSRSLWSDNVLLIAAGCHFLGRSRGELRIRKHHQGSYLCLLKVPPASRAVCSHSSITALQASLSSSTELWALVPLVPLVPVLLCSSWDAQCHRATHTGWHLDGNRHCALLNLQRPPLPLSLFFNTTSLPLLVSLGRKGAGNEESAPALYHMPFLHIPDWISVLRITTQAVSSALGPCCPGEFGWRNKEL